MMTKLGSLRPFSPIFHLIYHGTFSVDDCKKRWRNIKDTYMKIRRSNNPTGSPAQPKTKWPLYGQLCFLDNVSYERG